jgi:hypothetical protein
MFTAGSFEPAVRKVSAQTSISRPLLGLVLGGVLGLADGLSGFLSPKLAPIMTTVIAVSVFKGLGCGVAIGAFSRRVQSLPLGIVAGVAIALLVSYGVVLHAGQELFWDIMLPGALLGVVVGIATQIFGRAPEPAAAPR